MTQRHPAPGSAPDHADARRPPLTGMRFLRERRAGEFFTRGSLRKPQDLIGFILGHRAPPPAPAPRVSVSLACLTPAGKTAVEISV